MISIEITENEANRRLDRYLKKYLKSAPLSFIYRIIRKDVKVNGKRAQADTLLKIGDTVDIYLPEEQLKVFEVTKKNVKARRQFQIVFEDENILIVNKPFGLLTHGDDKEKKNTLANQVLAYLIGTDAYNPRISPTFSPAPANRLDRNTTGLVMFGKNLASLQALTAMIRGVDEGQIIEKYYLTIVKGIMKDPIVLTNKMVRDQSDNKTKVLDIDSKEGIVMRTEAKPLSKGKGYTLVEAKLITGRTHQIRAHLAEAGHPIIGDKKYGDRKINAKIAGQFDLNTQLLHAYKLKINECDGHLSYLKDKVFEADPPEGFFEIATSLGCKINIKK